MYKNINAISLNLKIKRLVHSKPIKLIGRYSSLYLAYLFVISILISTVLCQPSDNTNLKIKGLSFVDFNSDGTARFHIMDITGKYLTVMLKHGDKIIALYSHLPVPSDGFFNAPIVVNGEVAVFTDEGNLSYTIANQIMSINSGKMSNTLCWIIYSNDVGSHPLTTAENKTISDLSFSNPITFSTSSQITVFIGNCLPVTIIINEVAASPDDWVYYPNGKYLKISVKENSLVQVYYSSKPTSKMATILTLNASPLESSIDVLTGTLTAISLNGQIGPRIRVPIQVIIKSSNGYNDTIFIQSEDNGEFFATFKPPHVGTYSINVSFLGDDIYEGSSANMTINVKSNYFSLITVITSLTIGMIVIMLIYIRTKPKKMN